MTTQESSGPAPVQGAREKLDAHVRDMVQWHFSPDTGCPFWLDWAAKAGWEHFFGLCALISMNLAVLNALPIPILDGGHMAILCAEKLRRKDFSIQMKERILTGGFFFMVTLMGLVIALDLWRLKH